jgi:A/G-specific adenine glycosylase
MRTARLRAWFRRAARDLPWRRTKHPYAVWVSEVMLQQTQVATVVPYYERWMKRFPTVRALARASLDEVLKVWEGLGYYARARNLHRAAREMRRWPRTAEEWRRVPGVGPYTAAAIASIAHGERAAVFDGNVRRVLSRLEGRDVGGPPPVPRGDPGEFNQALMELGQRICTPRAPRCGECPLAGDCRGRASGDPERWPSKKPRKEVPHREVGLGIVWRGGRFYVQRRAEEGLLGGLWEFPGGKRESGESFEACVRREVEEETGFRVTVGPLLAVVPHRYSHFSVELHAYHCFLRRGGAGEAPGRWVTLEEAEGLAMPAANRRILESLRRSGRPPERGVGCGSVRS